MVRKLKPQIARTDFDAFDSMVRTVRVGFRSSIPEACRGAAHRDHADLTIGTRQPDGYGLPALRRDGFATVLDLRAPREAAQALLTDVERAETEGLGSAYINISVPANQWRPSPSTASAEAERLPKPLFVHYACGKRYGPFAAEAPRREGPSKSGHRKIRPSGSRNLAHVS